MLRTELPQASRVVRPDFRQRQHRGLDVVQLDEMKLDVLPRRDVAEPARILLADVGQRAQLRRGQQTLRDLDPEHLRVFRLALSVSAADQPERAPLIRRHLAALVLAEHGDELLDIGLRREA